MRRLKVRVETWPLRAAFTIARGTRTEARVVVVELHEGAARGRGEGVPTPRYGEDVAGVVAQIEDLSAVVGQGLDREALQEQLPPGAARNALDAALWDLEAKREGKPVWALAGLEAPRPVVTAMTVSIDTPGEMGKAAAAVADYPLLKIKLNGEQVIERVSAVRRNAPRTRLVVDANEAWTPELFSEVAPKLAEMGVEMIEQPLPAEADLALAEMSRPVPVCADESCHDTASVADLATRYDMVNIKLDKTGGLTEAMRLRTAAEAHGLAIMIGCMVGTSLSMAPGVLIAQGAAVVDLDGPLWMKADREEGLVIDRGIIQPPTAALWGA
jgi:L-alanine-DL-glutamate epimerase-like enolase superfamily enzyme